MDLFEEINKEKKDFPKKKAIADEITKSSFNFYQIFSIVLFLLFFFLGIFFGNLFATCQASTYFYSDACLVTEFNYSLMIFMWFIGVVISVFFFSIGQVIELLKNISEKLSKFKA